jgi:iron complex transport system ATP-binding protein
MTLIVDDLSFAYGRLPALEAVSARADAGKVIAVLGPNAAGKSTLLRCIIGALRPRVGQVSLDGQLVHRISPRALAQRIAYVPQRSSVSAAFTVRQVIELGRYALPPNSKRINDAIARFDLTAVEHRPYRALSVGQQQRVTLARAIAQLATRNGVLVLDEPTAAMDLRHVAQAHEILREAANVGGATIILAVHDLGLAAAVADECWLLDRGRLIAAGSTRDVLDAARLEQVFGVGFAWVNDDRGRPRLLAELPRSVAGEDETADARA